MCPAALSIVYRDILGKVIPEMPEIYKPKKIEPAGPPNKRRKAVESSAFPYARGNGTVNIKFNGQAPTKYESDSDEEEEDSPDTGDSTTDTDSDASYDEAYGWGWEECLQKKYATSGI